MKHADVMRGIPSRCSYLSAYGFVSSFLWRNSLPITVKPTGLQDSIRKVSVRL